jgi:hypothetical protein
MKIFNFLWILSSALSCNLAGKMILTRAGILEKSATLEKISNLKKSVVFIKMHHVGTTDFYNDVKAKVDSLHLEGYIFLYEGVTLNPELDSLKMDTVKRKYRKLFGFGISNKGYLDTTDHSIMGNKLRGLKELINQPKYDKLGINPNLDKLEDLSADQLINIYEKDFGLIFLSQCDMMTPFNERYECTKPNEKAQELLIKKARNENILKAIEKQNVNKIGIIYGSDHIEEIIKNLKKIDSNWVK